MNRVVLVGRVTIDPQLQTSNSGVPYCSFQIAVNRVGQNQQGERSADFINCVAFNKQAENFAQYVKKGGLIAVEGKLQTSSYQGQDGSRRTRTDVVCDMINFLSSPQRSNSGVFNDMSYPEEYDQTPRNSNQGQNINNQYGQNRPMNNNYQNRNNGYNNGYNNGSNNYNNYNNSNNFGYNQPNNQQMSSYNQDEPIMDQSDNNENNQDSSDDDLGTFDNDLPF